MRMVSEDQIGAGRKRRLRDRSLVVAARETDAVGVLRTLAAYRGAAGAAGVIEVGMVSRNALAAPFPKE